MIGWASDEMGAQIFMQLLPKASNIGRSSIRDDGLRDAMIADNVWYVKLGILTNPVSGGYGYKVGWLSQTLHDDPYRVVPRRGVRQTHNEVHTYVFSFSHGNAQGL
jgi:hypothetical protein